MEEASKPDGRSHGAFRCILGGAVLLVLYVLSSGPICKLATKGFISKQAVIFAYIPLGMLENYSQPVRRFFDWYIGDVWKAD